MNNKPIFIMIAGTILGSLITTTSYAWQPPSKACVDTRNDFKRVMYVIQRCKNFDPRGSWICGSNPLQSAVSEMKKNCLAILRHECRSNVDDPGVVYDLNALEPVCPSVVGTWVVSIDTGCDGVEDANHTTIYNDDFTWNGGDDFPNGGNWTQDGCDIAMADFSFNPPLIWNATLGDDGNQLYDGIFSGIFNGCWTATRI